MTTSTPHIVWVVAALSTAGVLIKPFGLPEAWWAVLGAAVLCVTGQLSLAAAGSAVAKGTDVYLFLAGMMLVAELARTTGLFDWIAAQAVRRARNSARRLFCLVYGVGVGVTVFMSNDATAVVLTPAVLASAKAARLDKPLPHLLACALVANAASFVLPISNPANLVVFAGNLPALAHWLRQFWLPSVVAVTVTFALLYWNQRRHLQACIASDVPVPALHVEGRLTAAGIALMAALLLGASASGADLGVPACAAGVGVLVAVLLRNPGMARRAIGGISWGVLPLVAGLFVLVEGLTRTGVTQFFVQMLADLHALGPRAGAWVAGLAVGLASNIANNLPAGLFAGATLAAGHAAPVMAAGVLIGIDLGPNLSVTGSLATILWLYALRREGVAVGGREFLRTGLIVMPAALGLSLLVL